MTIKPGITDNAAIEYRDEETIMEQYENKEKAWSEYVRLCEAGGSESFLKLVEVANLKNPFVDGTIASVIPQINDYLDKVDDKKL